PENVKPGVQFQAQGPDGQVQLITVREVSDAGVTIDANHPLAGQVLHFDVSVEEVREASEEEIAHGHVH
ncbi:MAG: peptidylprolyl isomerase, partial [Gammaproteobacteria bacterium]